MGADSALSLPGGAWGDTGIQAEKTPPKGRLLVKNVLAPPWPACSVVRALACALEGLGLIPGQQHVPGLQKSMKKCPHSLGKD